jgi:hypothetical protein
VTRLSVFATVRYVLSCLQLFGRSEIMALGELFGISETEIKATVLAPRFDKALAQQTAAKAEDVSFDQLDRKLKLDPSPSVDVIKAAVNWVMLRHQPAFTVVPPNIQFKLKSTKLIFRSPLQVEVREDIGSITAGAFEFDLVITSTAFQQNAVVSFSADNKSSAAKTAPSTPYTPHANSRNSIARTDAANPIFGGLNSLLAVPSNVMGTPYASAVGSADQSNPGTASKPTAAPNLIRSLQGIASLVGALVQLKATVASLSIEVAVKDKDLMAAMNGTHAEDDASPLPEEQSDSHLAAADGNQVLNYMRENESKTVLQAMQTAEKHEQVRQQRPRPPPLLSVPVFSCKENFMTVCLLADLDEATEGAADVQLLTGDFNADLSGALLSRVMDQDTVQHVTHALTAINSMFSSLALGEETAYIIDHVSRFAQTFAQIFDLSMFLLQCCF